MTGNGPLPWRWLVVVGCAFICLLLSRVLSPYNLWDKAQPKTIAYTSDIVAHGRFILPIEAGEYPATKPPLYNWIAAPFVALCGFDCETAHKAPSILALAGCVVALLWLGRRISPDKTMGPIAALVFLSSHSVFKLGYLARPDMLLSVWLLAGWIVGTSIIARGSSTHGRRILFWLCVGLAGLTKGPAALILLVYAVVLGKVLTGRWSGSRELGWWTGLPLALAMVAAWLIPAAMINGPHVREVLWGAEIIGRVSGTGPEGNSRGPIGFFTDFYYMPLYFIRGFAPWSLVTIPAGMALLKREGGPSSPRGWRSDVAGTWALGGLLFLLITIGLFTLSTGKRADYLAVAFAPASVLAAWWLVRLPAVWGRPFFLSTVVITQACLAYVTIEKSHSPCPGFADGIEEFFDDVLSRVKAEPLPVATWRFGPHPIQALLGISATERQDRSLMEALATEDEFWVVGGLQTSPPFTLDQFLLSAAPDRVVEQVAASRRTCREAGWPEQAYLYRVRRIQR